MKFNIPRFADKVRKKVNVAAVKAKIRANGALAILSGTSGESQHTSMLGGVIASLLVVALVIGFSTGFIQNTIFPDFKSHYKGLWG